MSLCCCSPLSALLSLVAVVLLSVSRPLPLLAAAAAQSSAADLVMNGPLSLDFYQATCPDVQGIVRDYMQKALGKDVGLAAQLLRLHYHDCVVLGCDGSVLLDATHDGEKSEKDTPGNMSFKPSTYGAIEELRGLIDARCQKQVVSCADILALAARESVFLLGGPEYPVPLGRRDGLKTDPDGTDVLPRHWDDVPTLLANFAQFNFSKTDMVALSGAHTIGVAHCPIVTERLAPVDPTIDEAFARSLNRTCAPSGADRRTAPLDALTPAEFDNKYYVDIRSRRGLLWSDQNLLTDERTRGLVMQFAADESFFFEKFAAAMVKMGQIDVLTGEQGEVRVKCSARNAAAAGVTVGVLSHDEGARAAA